MLLQQRWQNLTYNPLRHKMAEFAETSHKISVAKCRIIPVAHSFDCALILSSSGRQQIINCLDISHGFISYKTNKKLPSMEKTVSRRKCGEALRRKCEISTNGIVWLKKFWWKWKQQLQEHLQLFICGVNVNSKFITLFLGLSNWNILVENSQCY